jgi:PKD repeat protein
MVSGNRPYALVVAGPLAEIVVEPISGLAAANDSPTTLGGSTSFTATISAGTDVVYTWDFGDSSGSSGQYTSHTYASAGQYTAVVTASNSISSLSNGTTVTILEPVSILYLPVVFSP